MQSEFQPNRVLNKFLSPLKYKFNEKHLPEWHFYLPQKEKELFLVLKVVCPQYTLSLPNSGNCYFLVFQNACPNLTITVETRYKEIWYNKVSDITNSFLWSQWNNLLCFLLFIDNWYNKISDITNKFLWSQGSRYTEFPLYLPRAIGQVLM